MIKISDGNKISIVLIIILLGLLILEMYWWGPIFEKVEELENRLVDLEIRATRAEVALEQNDSFDKVKFLDELRNEVLEERMILLPED